jgi:hypothetical protein
MSVNTDRKKVLQMTILAMMRAMRSVLCDVLPARLTPWPSPLAYACYPVNRWIRSILCQGKNTILYSLRSLSSA